MAKEISKTQRQTSFCLGLVDATIC